MRVGRGEEEEEGGEGEGGEDRTTKSGSGWVWGHVIDVNLGLFAVFVQLGDHSDSLRGRSRRKGVYADLRSEEGDNAAPANLS